jgi:phosphatidate phosphatase APP1
MFEKSNRSKIDKNKQGIISDIYDILKVTDKGKD